MLRAAKRWRFPAAAPDARPRGRSTGIFRAFRHRNYRLFFSGQVVSLIGTWMQSVAQAWLVYRLTGSTLLLGLINFANQIPIFLLSSFGGAIADRRDRRSILLITQSAAMLLAFALAALTLSHHVQVWHVFALSALLGVVSAVDMPTRQAFAVELVGGEDLMNAIALNSSAFNGARVIGPAVAGLLVGALGEGWAFFLNGASFLAVIAALALMRLPRSPIPPRHKGALAHIGEGFAFVARARPILALMLLLGLVSLASMPYAALMPVFAERILGGGAATLGVLMGASGVGALIGGLTLAARKELKGLGGWVVAAAAVFGVALIAFAFSRSLWLSLALLVPVGFALMVQMAGSNTLVQSMVPDALRGRVMAVYSMMFMGMAPFGALLGGALASRIGAPTTVALGGCVCLAASLVFAILLPRLRGSAREMILAQRAARAQQDR